MLAVTAGDGACVENSTKPTARVSTLTASGIGPAVLRFRQQAKRAGGINDKEHAMSQKFREGPWPKNTDRVQGHCIYKTPLRGVFLQAMASYS